VPSSADTGEGGGASRGPATPEGYFWTNDTRLTFAQYGESQPALAVDSNGDSFVSWNRSGQMMLKKVNVLGADLLSERLVSSGFIPLQHSGQPNERMCVDRQNDLGVLWCNDDSVNDPAYQRFASSGNQLCLPKDLAGIATNPHAVSLACGNTGRHYLVFENEPGEKIEMAYFDSSFQLHSKCLSVQDGRGATAGVDGADNPHVFWRSSTNGTLYFAKFDSAGNMIQAVTSIAAPPNMSVANAPLPTVAFRGIGVIYLLQASNLTGCRTLYYTKLDYKGARLTNDTLITDRAADFGDICVDLQGNALCIWGDAVDGELYYTQIKAGRENDTILPVKLTDAPGISKDPKMAVDAADRVHVVWVDGRDGTDRIYYKLCYNPGVELSMPPEETARMMYVHPDQTVSANVTLHNTGIADDTAHLGITADFYGHPGGTGKDYSGNGWKVWIDDRDKSVDLAACATVKFPVSVRGPVNGSPNEYIMVTIIATSGKYPLRNATFEFIVRLVVNRAIMLKNSEHIHSISAGASTQYNIVVANTGDVEETVDLTVNGPPSWQWVLNVSEVRLKPKAYTYVLLTVTSPADAWGDELGLVIVTGRCRTEPSIKAQVSVHTVVSTYLSLEVLADRTEASVDPGGTTGFVLTVWNHGNMLRGQAFAIGTFPAPKDWVVSLSADSVMLEGEDYAEVMLNVTAPENASAGSKLVVTVNCSNAEKTVSAGCTVTVNVNPVHGVMVSVAPEVAQMEPGGTADLWPNITNTGNTDEAIWLGQFEMPAGWSLWFELPDGRILGDNDSFSLGAGRTAGSIAVIASPFDALSGDYHFPGVVNDGAGGFYQIVLSVHVNQVHFLELNATSPERTGSPGKAAYFPLTVINLGNGPEALQLECSAMPAGWYRPLFRCENDTLGSSLDLNASGSVRMTACVLVPVKTPLDVVHFNVTASSCSGISASVFLTVRIEKADLVITHVSFSSSVLQAGKRVTVNVTVGNRGGAAAEYVTTAFFCDGDVQMTRDLTIIEAGARDVLSFIWTPKKGLNILKFAVDNADSVCESDETNNTVTITRTPIDESVTIPAPSQWPAYAAAAIIIVIVLCIVIRRNPGP
jgi:uncharacterized membrane protein